VREQFVPQFSSIGINSEAAQTVRFALPFPISFLEKEAIL